MILLQNRSNKVYAQYYTKFKQIQMNYQGSVIPDNAHLRLSLKDSVVHHFQNKKKEKIAEGTCRIYETDQTDIETPTKQKSYFMSVKNFIDEILNSKTFIRINYPENTSYLFQKQTWAICAISFNKNKGYEQFDKLFSTFAIILDFNSDNISPELKQKISQHCPDNIQTKDITSDFKSILKKFGKNVGILTGKANNIVSKPANNAASSISERASRISRDSISDNTKTKWNAVKQKSDKINQSLTQLFRPVVNKYRSFQDYVGQTFKNSENKVVKTVREYSQAFSQSMNEGEKSTHQQQVALNEAEVSSNQLN